MRRLLHRLDDDERGNVLALFVAGALLLGGLMWLVTGVGQRIVQHRTMQTAADAAALSAAAMKARGMNAVARSNLTMAGLYATWAAHRLAILAAQAAGQSAVLIGSEEARLVNAMSAASNTGISLAVIYAGVAKSECERVGARPEYHLRIAGARVLTTSWPPPGPLAQLAPRAIPLGGLCSSAHGGGASADLCDLRYLSSPMVLSPEWSAQRFSHGYALMTATQQGRRRALVAIARGGRLSEAPIADRLLATAQAQTYSTGGHEDLWHADWSARLVRYRPIDLSPTAGRMSGDAGLVLDAVREVEASAAHHQLRDRYEQH
jgi:hypothetical protein